jgi:AGCS family alanine or glycine:cation symporter
MSFLVGVKRGSLYNYYYLATIIFGAVVSMETVINIIDIAYAIMAFPTMLSGFVLAPKVMAEAKRYFANLKRE